MKAKPSSLSSYVENYLTHMETERQDQAHHIFFTNDQTAQQFYRHIYDLIGSFKPITPNTLSPMLNTFAMKPLT